MAVRPRPAAQPGYHDPYSHALLALIQGLYDRAEYPFPKERGRANLVAGGGAPEDFEAAWQRRRDDQAHFLALTREGAVSATVVGQLYAIAATAA